MLVNWRSVLTKSEQTSMSLNRSRKDDLWLSKGLCHPSPCWHGFTETRAVTFHCLLKVNSNQHDVRCYRCNFYFKSFTRCCIRVFMNIIVYDSCYVRLLYCLHQYFLGIKWLLTDMSRDFLRVSGGIVLTTTILWLIFWTCSKTGKYHRKVHNARYCGRT